MTGAIASRNGSYLVQVFRSAGCDGSGRGEGTSLVTSAPATISNAPIGGNGSASFDFELPTSADLTDATLTATLVDADGNTSEFSACRTYETVRCREIFRDGLESNPPPPACTPP